MNVANQLTANLSLVKYLEQIGHSFFPLLFDGFKLLLSTEADLPLLPLFWLTCNSCAKTKKDICVICVLAIFYKKAKYQICCKRVGKTNSFVI